MLTVWKYPLTLGTTDAGEFELEVPADAKFIHVDLDPAERSNIRAVRVWALVNPVTKHMNRRKLRVVGTGHPINSEYIKHIGSVVAPPFIWHVFEVVE